jgi:hypothetical protein
MHLMGAYASVEHIFDGELLVGFSTQCRLTNLFG